MATDRFTLPLTVLAQARTANTSVPPHSNLDYTTSVETHRLLILLSVRDKSRSTSPKPHPTALITEKMTISLNLPPAAAAPPSPTTSPASPLRDESPKRTKPHPHPPHPPASPAPTHHVLSSTTPKNSSACPPTRPPSAPQLRRLSISNRGLPSYSTTISVAGPSQPMSAHLRGRGGSPPTSRPIAFIASEERRLRVMQHAGR